MDVDGDVDGDGSGSLGEGWPSAWAYLPTGAKKKRTRPLFKMFGRVPRLLTYELNVRPL